MYDANGNVVIDLNKNTKDLNNVAGNGIKYNFLDKPEQIRIAGKGTITISYSAAGEKLQRTFTPEPSGSAITTSYINQFIYQETAGGAASLQFINFEEGRIRVVTPTSQGNGLDALIVDGNMDLPNAKRGAYDYFIMDYLQNVRMILTEEVHIASNTATLETNRSTLEESIFGQTGSSNEVAVTRYDKPAGWTGNTTAKVSRVGTNSGHNIGPNALQKVMAGDVVNATVLYYHQGSAGGNSANFLNTLTGNLVGTISSSNTTSSLVKGQAAAITGQLGGTGGFINAVQPNGANPGGDIPQSFLTVLFFDERFNFIEAADGGVAQQQVAASVGSNGSSLTLANIKAPKNGYAYIYISNQSNNDVYFDDLQVGLTTGNIIEENHYYSYGLKIAAISSKKLGDSYEGQLKNNYLYQGAYAELDEDIGWHDFYLRNYDAQIGRWVQQDPYQEYASPYIGIGCDPINLIDPSGGFTIGGLTKAGTAAILTLGGAIIGTAVGLISGDDDFTGTLIGAGVGLGAGLGNLINSISTSMCIQVANTAVSVININLTTEQAGHGPNINNNSLDNFAGNPVHYSFEEYVELWENTHDAGPMSDAQKKTLKRGCIGIVALELGTNLKNTDKGGFPSLDNAWSSFDKANKEMKRIEKDIKDNPEKYDKTARVIIFSVRFYCEDETECRPDKDGRIDMSKKWYNMTEKPAIMDENGHLQKFVNYDYVLYDRRTFKWYDSDGEYIDGLNMNIYEHDSIESFQTPYPGFNRDIFCVGITTIPLKK